MGKGNDKVVVRCQTPIPILDDRFGDFDLLPVTSVDVFHDISYLVVKSKTLKMWNED